MTNSKYELEQGALHVSFAVDMACSLIPYTNDHAMPAVVEIACLESYMTNMRVLVEFFARRRDSRDIHRYDYLPGWESSRARSRDRLLELWQDVSQNVSHLSWSRVPAPDETVTIQNVSPPVLTMLAILMLDLAEDFADALEAATHPDAVRFRAAVDLGKARLSPP